MPRECRVLRGEVDGPPSSLILLRSDPAVTERDGRLQLIGYAGSTGGIVPRGTTFRAGDGG